MEKLPTLGPTPIRRTRRISRTSPTMTRSRSAPGSRSSFDRSIFRRSGCRFGAENATSLGPVLSPALDQLGHAIEVDREIHLAPAQALDVAGHDVGTLGDLADGAQ